MRVPWAVGVTLLAMQATAADTEALTGAGRAAAGQLTQQLGAELRKELAAGGPESAIGVCKELAPQIAGRLSRESGGRVARVSLKTRNPLLGTPDVWEQTVLADFERRVAAGEKPETLEHAELVSEPAGRYFRYMKAIPVQPLCLACHGSPEGISEAVKASLRQEYPHDRAVGYSVGQIRGAVTVKQRME
jgi:uncharacterized protein DUF3365